MLDNNLYLFQLDLTMSSIPIALNICQFTNGFLEANQPITIVQWAPTNPQRTCFLSGFDTEHSKYNPCHSNYERHLCASLSKKKLLLAHCDTRIQHKVSLASFVCTTRIFDCSIFLWLDGSAWHPLWCLDDCCNSQKRFTNGLNAHYYASWLSGRVPHKLQIY